MSRAKVLTDTHGRFWRLQIRCPAGHDHLLPVDWTPAGMERSTDDGDRPRWGFNGDLERPTLTPSIAMRRGHYADGTPPADCCVCKRAQERGRASSCCICHTFVRDGRVQFLADCTHALAGQTFDLPEIEDDP